MRSTGGQQGANSRHLGDESTHGGTHENDAQGWPHLEISNDRFRGRLQREAAPHRNRLVRLLQTPPLLCNNIDQRKISLQIIIQSIARQSLSSHIPELVRINEFTSPSTFLEDLDRWIDGYNANHLHSTLGYRSPEAYEAEQLSH